MLCANMLGQCNAALDRCLLEARMGNSGAMAAAMIQAWEYTEQAGAMVTCISDPSSTRFCDGRQCAEIRKRYKRTLTELQSMLPVIGASLERERSRLTREVAFVRAAQSWAESSKTLTAEGEVGATAVRS